MVQITNLEGLNHCRKIKFLTHLPEVAKQTRCGMLAKGVLLLHDDELIHKVRVAVFVMVSCGYKELNRYMNMFYFST